MAQTDIIYIYEFGGSFVLPLTQTSRQETQGKVRTRQTTSPCPIHFKHSSPPTMNNLPLPFKLECVK